MKGQGEVAFVVLGLGAIIIGAVYFMFVSPMMTPWWAEQNGKADYAQAEQNRQIAVLEAQAKLDSAKLLAQAEIERAKGVAQSNEIIGKSLNQNEAYLRYLWITEVAGNGQDKTIVYVPTETNLPILEANRFDKKIEISSEPAQSDG